MKFDEALEHVRKTKESLYAFIPTNKLIGGASMIVGGGIYSIEWNKDRVTDEDDEFYSEEVSDINITYTGGLFGSSYGEEGFYSPDDLDLGDEIKGLLFYPVKGDFKYGAMTEFCLFEIEGCDTSILNAFMHIDEMIKYINIQPFMMKFKS